MYREKHQGEREGFLPHLKSTGDGIRKPPTSFPWSLVKDICLVTKQKARKAYKQRITLVFRVRP
jgi:hypothetical protein